MLEEALPWDRQPENRWLSRIRPNTMFFSTHLEPSEMGVTAWPRLFWGAPSAQTHGCHGNECMQLLSSPPTAQASSLSTFPSLHSPQPNLIRQLLLQVLVTGNPKELWKENVGNMQGVVFGRGEIWEAATFLCEWTLFGWLTTWLWPQPLGKLTPPLFHFIYSFMRASY